MTNLTITRFNITPSGYSRNDTLDCPHGPNFVELLDACVEQIPTSNKATAWSFGKFQAGAMSGKSAVEGSSSCLVLEYKNTGKTPEEVADWVNEIRSAADDRGFGYYLINTMTRTRQHTLSVVFPLNTPVNEKRYARLVTVLAEQMGVGKATSGIASYTHLIHVHENTGIEYVAGPLISPDFYIKMTKHLAQNIDPTQFEKARSRADVHLDRPTFTTDEAGLFDWPDTHKAIQILERCSNQINSRNH